MAKREKQKRYSLEFRDMAVRCMKLGASMSQLSRELGVDRTCLYHWKQKHNRRPYSPVALPEPDWRDQWIEASGDEKRGSASSYKGQFAKE